MPFQVSKESTKYSLNASSENVMLLALGFGLFALLLLILHTTLDPKITKWLPEPSSLSIGILVQPAVCMEFFLGGLAVWWWSRFDSTAPGKVPYLASGAVAGSGIAVVCRSLLSLLSISPPMAVEWSAVSQSFGALQWIFAIVFIIIFLTTFACGMWYWNRIGDTDDFDEIV